VNSRKITSVLLGSAALILLIWDIEVAYNATEGDTISEIVRDLSHRFYSLPFTLMVVMGHLFWNQAEGDRLPLEVRRKVFWMRVAVPVAILLGSDVLNHFVELPTFNYANLVLAAIGFFVGAAWWPQALPPKEEEAP